MAMQFTSPTSTAFWVSMDAGRSWRPTGTIPERGMGQLLIGADADPAHLGCTCFFVAGGDNLSPNQPSLRLYTSRDGARWMRLPPLPVPGTTPTHTGLFLVMGLTIDGRLLALGADPATGVLGDVGNTPLALWAWNLHRHQWEAAAGPTPCTRLGTCFVFSLGLSRGVGPDGTTVGTWAWLGQGLTDELYRVFVSTQ
jgi:hypothetical protein